MLKSDVTKLAVVLLIAVLFGAPSVGNAPCSSYVKAKPPSREMKWENTTIVVKHSILVGEGEKLEIINSTVEMDTSRNSIGIVINGNLLVLNSTIRDVGEEGYYFNIFGGAEIIDSGIWGVRSNDPMGEGIIVSLSHIRVVRSIIRSYDRHAMTFYFPYVNPEIFVAESDIGGISLVHTYLNVANSTLGNLHFRYGPGEFHLYNCSYTDARSENAAFGLIYSWSFIQIQTSEPEANISIKRANDTVEDKLTTDENGYLAGWWMYEWTIVDPAKGNFVFSYNPFTFVAEKIVTSEFSISDRNGSKSVLAAQEYRGTTVQDVEENPMVYIHMDPVVGIPGLWN